MFQVNTLQARVPSRDPFALSRGKYVTEPGLDELMRDPMTVALMAADRVDVCELNALFADVGRNLR
ncbi:MAG TPA: hypothetical protein VMI30_12980 [Stellaceae bacterium]|nr:hypothetical protein [Stellaceae bacterium]